jgi:tetratricopeptide (TPR) repeat protein
MAMRLPLAIMLFATMIAGNGCNRVSAPNTSSANAGGNKAMREYDEAIQRTPMDAEAYAKQAYAWLSKGNYDKALNDYDQAIRLQPENAAFLNSRGFTWHMKGIEDKDRPTCEDRALSDYAEAIRINPKDASAINNRAWLWATSKVDRCRNGKQAAEEAKMACELTSWENAGYLDTLSVAYAEVGDFEQAIRWQRKALEDPSYQKEDGEIARQKLALFNKKQPFRE